MDPYFSQLEICDHVFGCKQSLKHMKEAKKAFDKDERTQEQIRMVGAWLQDGIEMLEESIEMIEQLTGTEH